MSTSTSSQTAQTPTTTPGTDPTPHTHTSLGAAWVPLLALCLAFFVEMVDNTLLTIALRPSAVTSAAAPPPCSG
nr:hypothetical protein [Quadrisphaera sp. INWT6]